MRRNDSPLPHRDHGGGVDSAVNQWGGHRNDWIDLSTGINPVPYPLPTFEPRDWTALPDLAAQTALLDAARAFWRVPDTVAILAAPGASALIAALPTVFAGQRADIPTPTYNEHAAAFRARGWDVAATKDADIRVLVHPNNPDGRVWTPNDVTCPQIVIDESFADTAPDQSLIARAAQPGGVVLKSFGKFWGLAGLRLGFAMALPETIDRLRDAIGPWAVSGPALRIGALALNDPEWAQQTRAKLTQDVLRLDVLVARSGATPCGGTTLFRLYDTEDAAAFQNKLAQHHIWSRIFPYSERWVRLGLPPDDAWPRLEAALAP